MEVLVQQRENPSGARLPGGLRLADDDRGHATHGGKGGEQAGRELPWTHENFAREQGVVAHARELGGRTWMTDEELALGGHEQNGEGRGGPSGPELVADRLGEPERLGDPDAVVGREDGCSGCWRGRGCGGRHATGEWRRRARGERGESEQQRTDARHAARVGVW